METEYKILLKQHIGVPATPLVKEGDEVGCGTLIASCEGLGANIFSPIEGRVCAITPQAIVLCGHQPPPSDYIPLSGNSPLELVKEAGLVGMGGAGFPTGVKLGTKLDHGYLLINAAECEPLLHHNVQQMIDQSEMTVKGILHSMKMIQADKAIIAIKAKNEEAVQKMTESIKPYPEISIHLLPDLYPMGEERAIVRETLGILLNPTDLPSAANAVVLNVETVYRVAQAIEEKRPCTTKNLTVVGRLKSGTDPVVFMDVPIGTTVGELIQRAGGIDGEYGEIIMGGPFTGKAVSADTPITKTTGGIIVTIPFPDLHGSKTGLLVCACGGNEERMRDLAKKMNGQVASVQFCKQAVDVRGTLKCENPGNCPGQAQKCLNFKKEGCEYIIIGNCSDCSNTVMGSAPKLKLKIFHQTDHVLRTVNHRLIRRLTISKKL